MLKHSTLIFCDSFFNCMSMITYVICYLIIFDSISISINCILNYILYYEFKSINPSILSCHLLKLFIEIIHVSIYKEIILYTTSIFKYYIH